MTRHPASGHMTPRETGEAMAEVVSIARRLLAEDGCAWDREQTLDTMTPYLVEEAHEVAEAIANDDGAHFVEELGDVLYLVAFLSELAEARYGTTLAETARANVAKLTRRHPHVFQGEPAATGDEALRKWEELKRAETGGAAPALGRAPAGLPSLLAAYRTQQRAAAAGFDWPNAEAALGKVEEELRETRAAIAEGERAAVVEEIGDLLFAIATLARHAGVDPEQALHAAVRRYRARFERLATEVAAQGGTIAATDGDTLLRLWREAKV